MELQQNAITFAGSNSERAEKYIERKMHLTKEKYTPFSEHTETIGKTTFSVTSYGDKTADKKPEQLIVQLLENKVLNMEEKTA